MVIDKQCYTIFATGSKVSLSKHIAEEGKFITDCYEKIGWLYWHLFKKLYTTRENSAFKP